MAIWVLSDLHLCFGVPSKTMEVFGSDWKNYQTRIKEHWSDLVSTEDLVLISGDISWAIHAEEVIKDLSWIHSLPGTKLLLKGNHDYWWGSSSKLKALMPPSIHFLQNNAFNWQDVSIGGSRLWDTDEYNYNEYIVFKENPLGKKEKVKNPEEEKKIFQRELERLKMSLKQLHSQAKTKIAMTHYPPIGPELKPSSASSILEEYRVDICVFGHLHHVKKGSMPLKEARGIKYYFASADYLDFTPIRLL